MVARSTGPILAIGAVTLLNSSVVHSRPVDLRVPVATAIAAGVFALAERGWEKGAVGVAWVALVSVLLTRIDPQVPSPVESLAAFWQGK